MRILIACMSIGTGAIVGLIVGGLIGWILLWIIDGANALSNPDLPGGMAWLVVTILAVVGLFAGGIQGIKLGRRMFQQWKSESQETSERDL